MNTVLHLIVVIVTVFYCDVASAAEYGHPFSLRIGAGINPLDPIDNFPYCFDFKTRFISGSAGGTAFKSTMIRDRKEFLRELNVSASAAGKYAFFSGSASGSLDERYSFSNDTLTWVVSLHTDLGKSEIYDEALKPFAAAMLAQKRHADFAIRCGKELISQERRVASVAAVFSMANLSEEQKRTIEAKFSAAGGKEVWNAEVSAKFRSFVEEASKTSRINLSVMAVGGPASPDLAALFTDYGDLQLISTVLRNYASKLSFENARTTSYTSTKMSRYGWVGDTLDVTLTDLSLSDYYLLYRDLEVAKQRAEKILGTESERAGLTASQLNALKQTSLKSETQMRRLLAAAKACRGDEAACVPASTFAVPDIAWPKIGPVGKMAQAARTVDCKPAAVAVAELKFFCSQTSTFEVVAKWPEVGRLDVRDGSGQAYAPMHKATLSLAQAYDREKSRSGGALTERRFIELYIGDPYSSLKEAEGQGWGVRELDLRFAFGESSAQSGGIKTNLVFSFFDTHGLRTERQAFMY